MGCRFCRYGCCIGRRASPFIVSSRLVARFDFPMARVEQDDLLLPSSAPSSTITLDRQFRVRPRHVGVAPSIHAPH